MVKHERMLKYGILCTHKGQVKMYIMNFSVPFVVVVITRDFRIDANAKSPRTPVAN